MNVSIKGAINKGLIAKTIRNASKRGMYAACDVIAKESKAQVPLDKGPLLQSCAIDVSEDGTEATISYDTPYAVKQHENLGYSHQRGRKAKYLEDPVNSTVVTDKALKAYANEAGGEFE